MKTFNIGLIGFGTVGSGVAEFLNKKKTYIREKYNVKFNIKTICDIKIPDDRIKHAGSAKITNQYQDILDDPSVNVIVELIGGLHPAKEIITGALQKGKHVVTANKALISTCGKELFTLAQEKKCHLYFESAVLAGVPAIKTITEGIIGNEINGIYGIFNGTCNYILTQMSQCGLSFQDAVKQAQIKGYAEADPTLDINGTDTAHKLAIMAYLSFGKFVNVKEIHTEGITDISIEDIRYAESLGLAIKLLAIAKRNGKEIEAHVYPTLIPKSHPLASINGVLNGIFYDADLLGKVLLSGQGAGKFAAASGVVSDLINLSNQTENELFSNLTFENTTLNLRKFDDIETKFYVRLMAVDKPGVLSQITGILGKHQISITSMNQTEQNQKSAVPVIMLTDRTTEKNMRLALKEIHGLPVIKSKPVAIRMEKLS